LKKALHLRKQVMDIKTNFYCIAFQKNNHKLEIMKKLLFSFGVLLCINANAQNKELNIERLDSLYLTKVNTIDKTIQTLYGVISGPKGQERNWELMRYIFHPEAKIIASGKRRDGSVGVRYVTMEEYIESSGKWMLENGFYEKEMKREVQRFGHIAQVFSSYETFHSLEDQTPFMRGINSIQMMFTGERWQVINIYFTQETPDNPIPEAFEKG